MIYDVRNSCSIANGWVARNHCDDPWCKNSCSITDGWVVRNHSDHPRSNHQWWGFVSVVSDEKTHQLMNLFEFDSKPLVSVMSVPLSEWWGTTVITLDRIISVRGDNSSISEFSWFDSKRWCHSHWTRKGHLRSSKFRNNRKPTSKQVSCVKSSLSKRDARTNMEPFPLSSLPDIPKSNLHPEIK